MKYFFPKFCTLSILLALLTTVVLNSGTFAMEARATRIQAAPLEIKYETFSESYEISLNRNGEKIAYVTYKPLDNNPNAWEIDFIFVEPEYRRKGYCAFLFVACFKEIIAKNARVVSWNSCPIEGNIHPSDLNALYQKLIIFRVMPLKNGELNTIRLSDNNMKMFYNFKTV